MTPCCVRFPAGGILLASSAACGHRRELKRRDKRLRRQEGFVCTPFLPPTQQPLHTHPHPPIHPLQPPPTPRNTHAQTRLPFFLITVSRKWGEKDNIVVTNGLKMSPTPLPFSLPNRQKSTHRIRLRVSPSRAAFTQSRRAL